ncbi:Spy/CpxP family protein refolding chaperone [Chondromyces crocatus]|uniref:Lipoprotein n=1 Tax=Chondromyces crocatus TaxID=52 RepID=A0A0K1EQG1_CHOCO|nr:Spy/CpxP family protein refolding chaperone [Chondromyces crocatus]AKT42863.1 uncharacterized protein CMC5_070910 [Chondromyces crocatus]
MNARGFRSLASVAVLSLASFVAACGSEPNAELENTQAEEQDLGVDEQAAKGSEETAKGPGRGEGRGPKGHFGKGGPGAMFGEVLRELELSDAQREAVKEVMGELRGGAEGKQPRALFAKLAAGVRAGSIDEAALQAELKGSEGEGRREAFVAAVQKLHQTLTPEQRKQLVAKISERAGKHEGRFEGKFDGKRGAMKGGKGRAHAMHGEKGGVERLLHGVTLREGQREQIETALASAGLDAAKFWGEKPDFEAMITARKALLDSFASDGFDAKAALPALGEGKGGPGAHLERMVASLKVVTPLLDDAQRAALADRLERGPMGMKGKRGAHRFEGPGRGGEQRRFEGPPRGGERPAMERARRDGEQRRFEGPRRGAGARGGAPEGLRDGARGER